MYTDVNVPSYWNTVAFNDAFRQSEIQFKYVTRSYFILFHLNVASSASIRVVNHLMLVHLPPNVNVR